MEELFPFVAGLLAGLVAARLPRPRRRALTFLAAVVLGLTATVVSGEFRVSWAYLLFDVPLVAVACGIGGALAQVLRSPSEGHRL